MGEVVPRSVVSGSDTHSGKLSYFQRHTASAVASCDFVIGMLTQRDGGSRIAFMDAAGAQKRLEVRAGVLRAG